MASEQYVKESPKDHGAGEKIAYTLTTTPWGSSPGTLSLAVYDENDDDADVTSTVVTGSTTASGDVITCGFISSLTKGRVYRAEITYTISSNIRVSKLELHAT